MRQKGQNPPHSPVFRSCWWFLEGKPSCRGLGSRGKSSEQLELAEVEDSNVKLPPCSGHGQSHSFEEQNSGFCFRLLHLQS